MMTPTFYDLLDMAQRRMKRDGQIIAEIAYTRRYAYMATTPADRHYWLNLSTLHLRMLLARHAGQTQGPHLDVWDAKHHADRYPSFRNFRGARDPARRRADRIARTHTQPMEYYA